MSFLEELTSLLKPLNIPLGFGMFPEQAGDAFIVYSPMRDAGSLFTDNNTAYETHEARIGLYVRNKDYEPIKNQLKSLIKAHEYYITDSRYIEFEKTSGYHHYNVDVAKIYYMEEQL